MAIYIDRPAWPWRGRLWSHLISDTAIEELHAFARGVPLRYLSFGIDHYDVPEELFDHSLALGAELIDSRDLVRHLRASGLRKSRGKVARTWHQSSLSDVGLASDQVSGVVAALERWGLGPADVWVVERPGTVVVVCELEQRTQPTDLFSSVVATQSHTAAMRAIETDLGDRWLVELVIGEF